MVRADPQRCIFLVSWVRAHITIVLLVRVRVGIDHRLLAKHLSVLFVSRQ